MMVFAWVVLPILCVIALAVFLYFKVSKGIECFFPAWTKKRKRIVSAVLSVVIIAPGFRIYGLWFIILLHVTVLLLLMNLTAVTLAELMILLQSQSSLIMFQIISLMIIGHLMLATAELLQIANLPEKKLSA